MFVQAGNLSEFFSAGCQERFATAHTNLLECFEAVRDEGRANHQKLFDARLREAFQFMIGVRLEPGMATEA